MLPPDESTSSTAASGSSRNVFDAHANRKVLQKHHEENVMHGKLAVMGTSMADEWKKDPSIQALKIPKFEMRSEELEEVHSSAKSERKRVKEFFKNSNISFPDPESEFPTFLEQEIIVGKPLGRGGFSDVAEIVLIQCAVGEHRQDTSNPQNMQEQHQDSSNSVEATTPTNNKESRKFMQKLCRRLGSGEARYAIKRLRPDIFRDRTRFYAGLGDLVVETRFLYHLEHPNIIKLRGIASVDPFSKDYFVILDRLHDTLQDRLGQWKLRKQQAKTIWNRLNCGGSSKLFSIKLLEEQLTAAFDLSAAFVYLHDRQICHRDIKPENIGFDLVSFDFVGRLRAFHNLFLVLFAVSDLCLCRRAFNLSLSHSEVTLRSSTLAWPEIWAL